MNAEDLIDGIPGWEDSDIREVYRLGVSVTRPNETCIEVGSWFGKSSAYLGLLCMRRRFGVFGLCIDTWRGTPGEHDADVAEFADSGGSILHCWRHNVAHIGVDQFVMPWQTDSLSAAGELAQGQARFPFVFLDDDHSEDHVRAELAAWAPLVRAGGILAGHDYDRESVKRPVDAAFGSRVNTVAPRCWWVEL